jgi:hypothetical protein
MSLNNVTYIFPKANQISLISLKQTRYSYLYVQIIVHYAWHLTQLPINHTSVTSQNVDLIFTRK